MKGTTERLRELMKSHNINHWQLKERINVEVEAVRRWLREPFPSISDDNLRKLAEYFGVHKAYLKYGIDDELIHVSLELQEYDPENFSRMKEIIRIILEMNKERRKRKYIEEYNRDRRTGKDYKSFGFGLTKEHERLLREIINNVVQGKRSTFSARSDSEEDIEKFRKKLKLLRGLRSLGYIKLPEINIHMNNLGKFVEAGPCELTFKGEGLIEYLSVK